MATHVFPASLGFDHISAAPAPQRGLFARFMSTIIAARQRKADREIARYLESRGWKFTDAAERDIERRFL